MCLVFVFIICNFYDWNYECLFCILKKNVYNDLFMLCLVFLLKYGNLLKEMLFLNFF